MQLSTAVLTGLAHAQLMGEDMAPGLKKGGYLNLTRRRLNCVGPAGLIPQAIEVDVSTLDFGQRIFLSSLQLPAGITIVDTVGHANISKESCNSAGLLVHF